MNNHAVQNFEKKSEWIHTESEMCWTISHLLAATIFSESQISCISMATILEFLLKYTIWSINYDGYLKLLKVI